MVMVVIVVVVGIAASLPIHLADAHAAELDDLQVGSRNPTLTLAHVMAVAEVGFRTCKWLVEALTPKLMRRLTILLQAADEEQFFITINLQILYLSEDLFHDHMLLLELGVTTKTKRHHHADHKHQHHGVSVSKLS